MVFAFFVLARDGAAVGAPVRELSGPQLGPLPQAAEAPTSLEQPALKERKLEELWQRL